MTPDDDDRTARIRDRAHKIWESEGRPDDREQVHWEIATRIIDEEDSRPPGDRNELDEAGADSFPASDPPSMTQPNVGIEEDASALSGRRRRSG